MSRPDLGNPGIGGTEYATVSLATEMSLDGFLDVTIISNSHVVLNPAVRFIKVESFSEAAMLSIVEGHYLVFRPTIDANHKLHQIYLNTKAKLIAWAHVTPSPSHLRIIANSNSVCAVVALGERQYYGWIDNPVVRKTFTIQNGQYPATLFSQPSEKIVTYLGALVPQKGFHVLAKAWPKVLKASPNAKLNVIGSGNLYNHSLRMGEFGLAEENYEKVFLKNLGNSLDSVKFFGRVSSKTKAELIAITYLGIVNPTGNTENCPASALDFQIARVPVVAGKRYGLIDVVRNNETGVLIRSERELARTIVSLLDDVSRRDTLAKNATEYVNSDFNFKSIIKQWLELISSLSQGDSINPIIYRKPLNTTETCAFFHYLLFRVLLGRFPNSSLTEYKTSIKSRLRKLKL